MTLHSFSSAPAGSANFSGCYPLLSPMSFDWLLRSGGTAGGLGANMELEQQQFDVSLCRRRRRSHWRRCVDGGDFRVAARFRSTFPIGAGCYFFEGMLKSGPISEVCWSRDFLAGSYFFG
jgi:hypothetical protein